MGLLLGAGGREERITEEALLVEESLASSFSEDQLGQVRSCPPWPSFLLGATGGTM